MKRNGGFCKTYIFMYRFQAINRMLRRSDLGAELRLRLIDTINNAMSIDQIKGIEQVFQVNSDVQK